MKNLICPYCGKETDTKAQRYDYQGNPAGVMCDECWKTSGLNPANRDQKPTDKKIIDIEGWD